jgi:hypothetical protein
VYLKSIVGWWRESQVKSMRLLVSEEEEFKLEGAFFEEGRLENPAK